MKHDINTETPLVPYIIAERALWNVIEADKHFEQHTPDQINKIVTENYSALVAKAETLYAVNPDFRKQLNSKTKDCRYTLEMFMEHWSNAIIKTLKQKPCTT